MSEQFEIELGDLHIDIEVTYWTPIVAATFHDPAEGGDVDYIATLDGKEYEIPDVLEDQAYQLIAKKMEGMH